MRILKMKMMAHIVLILVTINLCLDFLWDCTLSALLSQFFSSHLISSLSSPLVLVEIILRRLPTELDFGFMLSFEENRKKES